MYYIYSYFQELDNFFSEHFRWTPNSTSQVADHEDSSEDADDDGPADDTIDLDRRVMQFLDDSDDENGDDDENEDQRSSSSIENVTLPNDDHDLLKIREIKIGCCGCKNKCVSIFSDDTLYSHSKHERNDKGRKRHVHHGIVC